MYVHNSYLFTFRRSPALHQPLMRVLYPVVNEHHGILIILQRNNYNTEVHAKSGLLAFFRKWRHFSGCGAVDKKLAAAWQLNSGHSDVLSNMPLIAQYSWSS